MRDQRGQGHALLGLGQVGLREGRYERSCSHLELALRVATETCSYYLMAQVLLALGGVHRSRGRPRQAADHFRQALALSRDNHIRAAEAQALTALNATYETTGTSTLPGPHGPKQARA